MEALRSVLSDLMLIEGVNTATVISRDGFVIEGISKTGVLDTEAVGAVISTGVGSSEVMGRELQVGEINQGMFEFDDGIVVMTLLGPDAILAVVTQPNVNLGNIRYQLKKRSRDIIAALD